MKPTPHENPDLTAYALGELHARQARDVHTLLAACPVATHELEQIEAVTDALRQGAPIPQERLRPEQRHAVLYPTNLPRRMGPMMPRPIQRRPSTFWPVLAGVLKTAALVAVTGVAYFVGRHTGIGDVVSAAVADSGDQKPVSAQKELAPPPVDKTVAITPVEKPPRVKTLAQETPEPLAEKTPVVVVVESLSQNSPLDEPSTQIASVGVKESLPVAVEPARPQPITTPGKHGVFVNASRQPLDQFALRPASIRPLPAKVNKAELLASPAPLQSPLENKDNSKLRTPDLFIHSWKADVASCPWNENHRLLRVTVQLPADQPAAMTQTTYPMLVSFDPNYVREYRQLCERHQPAAELRQAGTHVVWYEFQPNGKTDANKTIATVTLENGRFTTQTVGPFDSSKLTVQDRGQSWRNAREDFVFDTAVVGFGLLMRGAAQTPKLNQALVLSLAEKSKGADTGGERGRFIRSVKEAAKAAGL